MDWADNHSHSWVVVHHNHPAEEKDMADMRQDMQQAVVAH